MRETPLYKEYFAHRPIRLRFTPSEDELHRHGTRFTLLLQHELPFSIAFYATGRIRLAIDAMDLLHQSPATIDTFVIVSSDSDFFPLVNRLRSSGKMVVVSGRKASTSAVLMNSCDRFIALDANTSSPIKTDEVAIQKPTDTSASTAINDESSIENGDGFSPTDLLLRAMEASMDEQGNVKGSMLHDTMRRIDPGFDFKKLGHRTFTRFLESSSDVKVMRSDGPGDMIIQLLHPQTEQYIEK